MQQASPNIVLILMDNLGYGEVGCYGGWPDQIPADRESNEIVHEVDTFTTLARFAGAVVPQDRPIDGVDLGDFFRGATDRSAREGFVIFFGEKIYGAKWRNFKMLLVEQVEGGDAVLPLGVPRLYNLYTNPKEDPRHSVATTHLWVMRPISKMIAEYQASLKQYPPIKVGTTDPYEPTNRSVEPAAPDYPISA